MIETGVNLTITSWSYSTSAEVILALTSTSVVSKAFLPGLYEFFKKMTVDLHTLELKQLIDTLLHQKEVPSISRISILKGHFWITGQQSSSVPSLSLSILCRAGHLIPWSSKTRCLSRMLHMSWAESCIYDAVVQNGYPIQEQRNLIMLGCARSESDTTHILTSPSASAIFLLILKLTHSTIHKL